MEELPRNQNANRNHDDSKTAEKFHGADLISVETVVNILVRKGICTPDELFEEERRRQTYQDKVKNISIVRTEEREHEGDGRTHRHRQSWLKRKMSKRRWSRRLGTALFGWQWKKVKVNPEKRRLENI